jgi:hypothetical protein
MLTTHSLHHQKQTHHPLQILLCRTCSLPQLTQTATILNLNFTLSVIIQSNHRKSIDHQSDITISAATSTVITICIHGVSLLSFRRRPIRPLLSASSACQATPSPVRSIPAANSAALLCRRYLCSLPPPRASNPALMDTTSPKHSLCLSIQAAVPAINSQIHKATNHNQEIAASSSPCSIHQRRSS